MAQKILLVEDDENIVKALSVRLRAKGYDVAAAFDAVMALAKAREYRPDLVLLDISMPAGNGFSVAERLQNSNDTMGTPIIFITASSEPGLHEKAKALGAVGFFEKPFEFEDLLSTIRRALGTSRLNEPANV